MLLLPCDTSAEPKIFKTPKLAKNIHIDLYTGSFKKIWTLATEVTGPHTLWFFLWGYVKDNAYKPPLPKNVRELQDRIRAAVQTIDGNTLKCVWQELDYRTDICRITKGAHIEHLWADFGKLGHLHYLSMKLYLILTINT